MSPDNTKKEMEDYIKTEEEVKQDLDDVKSSIASGKYVVIVILMCIIVFGSVFVYSRYIGDIKRVNVVDPLGNNISAVIDESYNYSNYTFDYVNGLWYTKIVKNGREYNIPLHYGPKEVEDIPIVGDLDKDFINDPHVFIAFDSDKDDLKYEALAITELSLNIARAINRKVTGACTKNITEACATMPIITCTSTTDAVIYVRESNDTKVIFEGNCITVQGMDMEITRAADRLLLYWYHVMRK